MRICQPLEAGELLRAVSESQKHAQIMKCRPLLIALTFPVSTTSIELADLILLKTIRCYSEFHIARCDIYYTTHIFL